MVLWCEIARTRRTVASNLESQARMHERLNQFFRTWVVHVQFQTKVQKLDIRGAEAK